MWSNEPCTLPRRAVEQADGGGHVEAAAHARYYDDDIETDFAGSCTLPLIVELVAGCMKRPAPQVVAATTRNAMTLFRLYKQPQLNIREDIQGVNYFILHHVHWDW